MPGSYAGTNGIAGANLVTGAGFICVATTGNRHGNTVANAHSAHRQRGTAGKREDMNNTKLILVCVIYASCSRCGLSCPSREICGRRQWGNDAQICNLVVYEVNKRGFNPAAYTTGLLDAKPGAVIVAA